jgi:hypothetical protein
MSLLLHETGCSRSMQSEQLAGWVGPQALPRQGAARGSSSKACVPHPSPCGLGSQHRVAMPVSEGSPWTQLGRWMATCQGFLVPP